MALADCSTAYWKELQLRMEFHSVTPPWERDVAAGGNYVWAVTSFLCGLHKTADPGEAGSVTTNAADYTGYASASVNRGVGFWTMTGAGTMTPTMDTSANVRWPIDTGPAQDIYAVSISMVYSATNYGMCRDASFAPVTIATDYQPSCPSGAISVRRR